MRLQSKPLRVLIVEDSPVVRTLLAHIIETDPRLTVAAAVATGEEALAQLDTVRPDVISMDIHLPGMNGLDATRQIMAHRPTPIVVISGRVERQALSSMDALRAGALAVVEKPVGLTSGDYQAVARDICTQLVIMSEVAVVRRRVRATDAPGRPLRVTGAIPPRAVVLAASTGGPQALARLLGALTPDFPLPILLVQHMGASFMDGFTRWLDSVVPLTVTIAGEGEALQPGQVYVAPGDRHLTLGRNLRIALEDGPPLRGQRPAATALFLSAADRLGAAAVGIVLTGMGEDGAPGVERLITAGAPVFAEEERSAVVYGMPAAAVRAGAVPLAIDAIAEQLTRISSEVRA